MELYFVIPVYNEEHTLETLARGIASSVGAYPYTILFVDDGSTDASTQVLERLAHEMPHVAVMRFRRNLGKSQALAAGFAQATGDVVITMDSDLQDDPKEIPRLLEKLEEGYDVVCGWKARRNDPWHKTFPSRIYNGAVSRLFGLELHDINTGFKAMRIQVAKRLALYGERHRLITVFALRMGYRVTEVPVEHHPRRFGHSHYGLERFSRGALDALSVWFLDRYQHSPNHFFGRIGVWAVGGGLFLFVAAALARLAGQGGGALMLLLACFSATLGLQFLALGLIAELIVRRLPMQNPEHYIEAAAPRREAGAAPDTIDSQRE